MFHAFTQFGATVKNEGCPTFPQFVLSLKLQPLQICVMFHELFFQCFCLFMYIKAWHKECRTDYQLYPRGKWGTPISPLRQKVSAGIKQIKINYREKPEEENQFSAVHQQLECTLWAWSLLCPWICLWGSHLFPPWSTLVSDSGGKSKDCSCPVAEINFSSQRNTLSEWSLCLI